MSRTQLAVVAALCLWFTGAPEVRAEEPQERAPADKRMGATVEVGSLAGFARYRGDTATGIGGEVGAFVRLGPALVGADYGYLAVGESPGRGVVERMGLSARLDLARIDRGFGGPNTALVLWVDAGVGHQRGRWHDGTAIDRNDVSAGWGWLLEHRVRLSTRPRRLETVGWKFGWRLTRASPADSTMDDVATCANQGGCTAPDPQAHDVGMVVSSSIRLDW